MLKTDLYSAIKSEDSKALDSGTSQLGSFPPSPPFLPFYPLPFPPL